MKKGNTNRIGENQHNLIELILSYKDCIHSAEELVRMNERELMKVRDSLLLGLSENLIKSEAGQIIQETSILGVVNDLFLARQ